ncbi:MAG: hypothetical protein GKR89_01880 [Candidatus Latescibacteria bacterium]|nr:hypothetical protein [Candidatus Latescibacterota bacterium]
MTHLFPDKSLAAYQNEDGGFGQALEPDLRTPLSTVYTTSQGLFLLREIGATSDDALVGQAVEYLLNTYDAEQSLWPIIPQEALAAPHAGHWDYIIENGFDDFFINMRTGLAGHFCYYTDLVPAGFASQITDAVLETLLATPDDQLDWIFGLLSYLGLAGTKGLPQLCQQRMLDKLRRAIPIHIERKPEKWSMLSVSPINMVPTPNAPMASVIDPALIQANLDCDIDQQLPDGTWSLDWSWAEDNPVAWKEAEREWKAHLAVGKLRALRAYGRIATPSRNCLRSLGEGK